MSNVNDSTLEHVERLARLKILDDQREEFVNHLSKLVSYFDELNQVDTKDIEPLYSPIWDYMREHGTPLRADEVKDSLGVKNVLANAPEVGQDQFKIRAVIEES